MGTIIPFLRDGAFDPKHVTAMSLALNDVCALLKLKTTNEIIGHHSVRSSAGTATNMVSVVSV